jgi:hypothetical protein
MSYEEDSKKSQENLDKFNKWYAGFIKACDTIGISREQGNQFIDIMDKALKED